MFVRSRAQGQMYHQLHSPSAVLQDNPVPEDQSPYFIQSPLKQGHGIRSKKDRIDLLDFVAVVLSITCLIGSVLVVTPYLPYAARLGVNNQIIALGFLLGLMNQALQRVVPYLCLLVEGRRHVPTLQNYEGILRWSPFADKLDVIWRSTLLVFIALPLVLSILYKRFIGGVASAPWPSSDNATYLPCGPPGLTTITQIMANATIPFLAAAVDEKPLPDLSVRSEPYGFNLLLISNTSAAALDGPSPDRVTAIQQDLDLGSAVHLKADVRGSIARYNATLGDRDYWIMSYSDIIPKLMPVNMHQAFWLYHADIAGSDDPRSYNASWVLTGATTSDVEYTYNDTLIREAWMESALRFDVSRHQCTGQWRITRDSVLLVSGHCDENLLSLEYQYYNNSMYPLSEFLTPSLAEILIPFYVNGTRQQSHWRIPTHAAAIASSFQSVAAAQKGRIGVQLNGPVFIAANLSDGQSYNASYQSGETLMIEVPTLSASAGLYAVLMVQPFLAVLCFCVVSAMYRVPIARTFGLVSILAGVDHDTLGLLSRAAFSGRLTKPLGLKIDVLPTESGAEHNTEQIRYRIGEHGTHGVVRHGRIYE